MSNKNIYITDKDFKKLQDLIKTAQEFKEEDEKHLNDLQAELNKAKVVDHNDLPNNIIAMYSKVEITELDSNEKNEYMLVFPDEADIDQSKISIFSPLGTSLIGEFQGTKIELKLASGIKKYKINKVMHNQRK